MKRFLSCLLILSALLAGCSAPPQGAPVQKAEEKVTLTVLAGQSTSDAGVQEMIDEEILDAFPEVDLEWEVMDWGANFHPQLQAKFASGEVPDLIIGKAQDVGAYAPSGFLAPLPEQMASYVREEGLLGVRHQGTLYGMPYNANYQGVLYNKNIFWRYGLTVPRTPADLREIVDKLKEAGVTPFATHFQENWFAANVFMQFASNQTFLQQPTWGDLFREGKVSFSTSTQMQNALRQVQDLSENTWGDAQTIDQAESDKRFIQEKAAMYVTGSWSMQPVGALAPSMQVGIFPYPNDTGDAKLLFEPNLTFMKGVNTAHSALADRILTFLFQDKDLAESICNFTQTAPLLRDVPARYPALLAQDVQSYRDSGRIADVTVGNNQIGWSFQDGFAAQINNWVVGKTDFAAVLGWADQNRADSRSIV